MRVWKRPDTSRRPSISSTTALHDHEKLGLTLPPGGHVDRDELPHEAGKRKVREETGLEPTIIDDTSSVSAPKGRSLPRPRWQMLYDINAYDGEVGHQHVDLIYYATVPSRDISPTAGEVGADAWQWYTPRDLRDGDLGEDVVTIGTEAIRTVSQS